MNCSKQTEMFMIIMHEAPTSCIKDSIEKIMDDSLFHPKALTNGTGEFESDHLKRQLATTTNKK